MVYGGKKQRIESYIDLMNHIIMSSSDWNEEGLKDLEETRTSDFGVLMKLKNVWCFSMFQGEPKKKKVSSDS